jgi:hypothetical protein
MLLVEYKYNPFFQGYVLVTPEEIDNEESDWYDEESGMWVS